MDVHPYLTFNGQCEAAFKFYEKTLGGRIETMMNHGDSPMADHVPPDWHKKILHATLAVDGHLLMGSDAPPDHYQVPKGFSVSLQFKNPVEADRVFSALADNGSVQMPIQETFWAARFGMLVDRFGIPWMINSDKAA